MITDHVHGSPHVANRGFEACRARPISNDNKRNTTAAVSADRSRGRRRLLEKGRTEFCCSTQTQETCNEKYNDHDADDVENIHCVLRLRPVRIQYEVAGLQSKNVLARQWVPYSISHRVRHKADISTMSAIGTKRTSRRRTGNLAPLLRDHASG